MGNAVWLIIALAEWYFPSIAAPWSAGTLTLIPAIGVMALAIGTVLGIRVRERSLLMFGALALGSHVYVGIAGFLRGTISSTSNLNGWPLWIFLLLEITLSGYLIYKIKNARLAAIFLAMFTSSYASFATFIAIMSFTDNWL